EIAHAAGALLIVVADPVNLGVLEAPGKLGADLVVGEGQGLGVPMSFGGPNLGVFAAKTELVRRMPGRLVGATVDRDGRRGFEIAHAAGALLIVVADPVNLGVLEAPGKLGADLVVGEGQGLGVPMSFGGPNLGVFAAKTELVRRMPGRLVGATVDRDGRRGF